MIDVGEEAEAEEASVYHKADKYYHCPSREPETEDTRHMDKCSEHMALEEYFGKEGQGRKDTSY